MSPTSWAVRYAASLDGVMMVLSGMSSIEQLRDNTSYMIDFKPLSDEEHKAVQKAADIINSSIAISCTACRYCLNGCPQHIAIPEYFALYNISKRSSGLNNMNFHFYYATHAETHGKASACIQCHKCEKACPQHLPITTYLEQVAAAFE